jgi:DNA invertase Pin-like site-specific DNA recombinase
MSSAPQEKSIPQQRAVMLPRAKLEGVRVVREFKDEAKSGGGMRKRDDFQAMLAFCQERHAAGKPVGAVVCYDTSRFSRADSNETAAYIWQLRQAGVSRLLTWERWYDFRKEEDRALFNIAQDFTNNRYLRNLSAGVLRGKKDFASAGFYVGGTVPYGFDRLVVDEKGETVERINRGDKLRLRRKGWHEVLSPIPEDEPDAGRQLERQTAAWLFHHFLLADVSFRSLAQDLNVRGVPGPSGGQWTCVTVRGILTNPVYRGLARMGNAGRGAYHRLVKGEVQPVEPGTRRTEKNEGMMLTPLECGGIVDAQTFDHVQAKAAERRKLGVLPRAGDYLLPSGILHCGHCGARMYGTSPRRCYKGKEYRYRKYICSGPKVKPGTCRPYAVDEDVIVKALVDRLLDVYTSPERLEGLRKKLCEKAAAGHQGAPEQAARLRVRLAESDKEIQQGRKNLLRVDADDAFAEAQAELNEWLAKRDRLRKELEAAERAQSVPAADVIAEMESAIDRLYGLRKQLLALRERPRDAPREKFREIMRLLVVRVDLYFESEARGDRMWYSCVKSAVKLRPSLFVSGYRTDGTCDDRHTRAEMPPSSRSTTPTPPTKIASRSASNSSFTRSRRRPTSSSATAPTAVTSRCSAPR